ncbi:2-aminoethanethiol (cysteamine) dioxygenase b [Centropristis striata]|uniref:2-aminoethanethiol (cysteamine) dioxygenase b n=1 Tax=Centropristis striata TaxID=184440 RepID=UPI0027E02B1E|nr:2-aminoethanethiol (cysteamine) dioxygenase b [Centropristis striata]
MMPADMSSLVQRVARQALATFRVPVRPGEDLGRSFLDNQNLLRSLLTEVRAADLKLVPRTASSSPTHRLHPGGPPVTYMHICETEQFSMGVFLLKGGASIPLHDHPGMHGMLKVLYGQVRISCFDRLERPPGGPQAGPPAPLLPPASVGALRRSLLRSSAVYSEEAGPCVLAPDRDNLHQIDSVDGPSAFMDILAPPYDPDDGRDCHYYKVLADPEGKDSEEIWLMEISQPPDFWCGGEPYPGPEVCL